MICFFYSWFRLYFRPLLFCFLYFPSIGLKSEVIFLSNYSCSVTSFLGESASQMIIWSSFIPSIVFPKPEKTCTSVFVLHSTFGWSRTQRRNSPNGGENLRKEDIRQMNGTDMNEEVQKHYSLSFSKVANSPAFSIFSFQGLSFAHFLQLRRIVLCNLVLWSQTKLYPFSCRI